MPEALKSNRQQLKALFYKIYVYLIKTRGKVPSLDEESLGKEPISFEEPFQLEERPTLPDSVLIDLARRPKKPRVNTANDKAKKMWILMLALALIIFLIVIVALI